MAEPTKAAPFQHVDGGLTEQFKANVVDPSRPLMERVASAMTLIGARALLDRMNADSMALPDTAARPAALPAELPPPKEGGQS